MITRLIFVGGCCTIAGQALAWPLALMSGVPFYDLWPAVAVASVVTGWAIILIKHRG